MKKKHNAHAYELQNFIITMHKTHMCKPSCDPDANQGRNDHLRQSQRRNCASRKRLARPYAQASKGATEAYQADRDARRADESSRVEDEGQRWLSVRRYGPKAGIKAR